MLYKDKEWLYTEYVTKERSMRSIAEPFGVDRKAIEYYIKKYNIPTRNCGNQKGCNDVVFKCDYCGCQTTRTKGDLKKAKKAGQKKFFCKRQCADKYHSDAMKGKKNPNFGGKFHGVLNDTDIPIEVRKERGRKSVEVRRKNGSLDIQLQKMKEGHLKYFSTEEGINKRRMLGVASVISQTNRRSSIEKIIAEELKKLNVKFEEQYRVGYWVADFYLPDYNLIIETNGDYWHGNTNVFQELTPKQKKRKTMDKAKETYSRNRGFNFLTLWEKDINKRLDWCVNQIKEAIRTVG